MKQRVATDERPFKTGSTDVSGQDTPDAPAATLVVPPDGGWGWVVVLASFLCNFLVDGILLSGGALMASIRDEFDASESEAALINSLLCGFYLLCGPFVSALANKFGFRVVTIVGSLIASAGFAVSYYATSVNYLYMTYGIIGGTGFCMIYMPAVLTVGFYFEKWRALATGLALCGSGVGTFVLSPLINMLLDEYGWRMTLLCQAGMILPCIFLGILFRPIKPVVVVEEPVVADDERHQVAVEKLKDIIKQRSKLEYGITMPPDMKFSSSKQISPHTWMGVPSTTRYPTAEEIFRGSNVALDQRRASATAGTIKSNLGGKPLYATVSERDEQEDGRTTPSADKASQPLIGSVLRIMSTNDYSNRQRMSVDTNTRPLYRDDIFFGASLARLPQYRSRTSIGYHMAVTHLPTPAAEEKHKGLCRICPMAIRTALATMLDVSLFKSITFVILAFSGFFTMLGFFVPFMFVQNRGLENGMSEESIGWLVSAIGVANIVGRVMCGVVTSMPKVSPLWLNNIAVTAGGIASIASGLSYNIYYQYCFCAIFGLSVACFASLRSIVIVEYLGLERLTNCFGLFLLLQGAGALLGAPIAGSLYDSTKSYDVSFYVSGGFMVFSAVLCYPIDRISKWEQRRSMRRSENPEN